MYQGNEVLDPFIYTLNSILASSDIANKHFVNANFSAIGSRKFQNIFCSRAWINPEAGLSDINDERFDCAA